MKFGSVRKIFGRWTIFVGLALFTAAWFVPPLSAEGAEHRSYVQGEEPHIEPSLEVSPERIWSEDSGLSPTSARVTLRLEGRGDPAVIFDPQDTIFVMDSSGSMKMSDPLAYRISGVKGYLDNMLPPDRGAVVSFSNEAELVNGHHLTEDYDVVREDLESITYTGGTNLKDAVALANEELLTHGDPGKIRMEVLLTDGKPDQGKNVTEEALREARDNNITIYTIGLGEDRDEDLLRYIAGTTGGEYYSADDPEVLVDIYEAISKKYKNFTAGRDANPTDDEPMVRLELPGTIRLRADTVEPEADHMAISSSNGTVLEWNISELELDENWTATFDVSASMGGNIPVAVLTGSRLRYVGYDDEEVTIPITPVYLEIRSVPPPPPPPPPPSPPPVTTPPAPPPPSVPVIAPTTNIVPTVTAQTNLIVTPTLQPAAIPVQYVLAGLAALGIAERTKLKKKLVQKHRVSVGA